VRAQRVLKDGDAQPAQLSARIVGFRLTGPTALLVRCSRPVRRDLARNSSSVARVRVIAHIEREAAMSTRQTLLATFDRFAARCGDAVPTEALSSIRGGLLRARHIGTARPGACAVRGDRRHRKALEFWLAECRNCATLREILRTRPLTARLNRQRALRGLQRYQAALERRVERLSAIQQHPLPRRAA